MKKILSLLCTAVLVCCATTMSVAAADTDSETETALEAETRPEQELLIGEVVEVDGTTVTIRLSRPLGNKRIEVPTDAEIPDESSDDVTPPELPDDAGFPSDGETPPELPDDVDLPDIGEKLPDDIEPAGQVKGKQEDLTITIDLSELDVEIDEISEGDFLVVDLDSEGNVASVEVTELDISDVPKELDERGDTFEGFEGSNRESDVRPLDASENEELPSLEELPEDIPESIPGDAPESIEETEPSMGNPLSGGIGASPIDGAPMFNIGGVHR